jgi:hypothetical protein
MLYAAVSVCRSLCCDAKGSHGTARHWAGTARRWAGTHGTGPVGRRTDELWQRLKGLRRSYACKAACAAHEYLRGN